MQAKTPPTCQESQWFQQQKRQTFAVYTASIRKIRQLMFLRKTGKELITPTEITVLRPLNIN